MVFITKKKIGKKKKKEKQWCSRRLLLCALFSVMETYLQETASGFDGKIAYLLF